MNYLNYPSPARPQFYLSNNSTVIQYFTRHFFFTKNTPFQFIISLTKLLFPEAIVGFFLKIALRKTKQLPLDLNNALEYLKEHLISRRGHFSIDAQDAKDIFCIIRRSAWQRNHDRYVIILFSQGSPEPFVVVKLGNLADRNLLEMEFVNTKLLHECLNKSASFYIPEPLLFLSLNKTSAYFERPAEGIPLNNYLKLILRKRKRDDLRLRTLEVCKQLLIDLNQQDQLMSPDDFNKYFLECLDFFVSLEVSTLYTREIEMLRQGFSEIQRRTVRSVWMHGDLWVGSILYGGKKTAVIDWEFFTKKGVPFWDWFSLIFHVGTELDYFTDDRISELTDSHLLDLSRCYAIDENLIPIFFQGYLLFNIRHRDTEAHKYWQEALESYWSKYTPEKRAGTRLL